MRSLNCGGELWGWGATIHAVPMNILLWGCGGWGGGCVALIQHEIITRPTTIIIHNNNNNNDNNNNDRCIHI